MKASEKELAKAIAENIQMNNYESDDFRLGITNAFPRPFVNPPQPALSSVPGQARTGTYVAEMSLTVMRQLRSGTIDPNNNLPFAIGSPFASDGGYRRIINQLLSSGITLVSVNKDVSANMIIFNYTTGTGLETITITSDYYDVVTILEGLRNIKAVSSSLSITTPNNSTLISRFVNTQIIPFSESWLTKIEKDQRAIKIAAGQFNANVFDINVPLVLSPTEGIAFSLPPIVNPNPTVGDTYNYQFYFAAVQKF